MRRTLQLRISAIEGGLAMGKGVRVLGIPCVLAGLALAGATTATASTSRGVVAARALSVKAVAAHSPSATKRVRTVRASVASVATKPGGYKVIVSGPITADNGFQTGSSLACPIVKGVQTVPLDGGAVIESSSLFANINTSEPEGTVWVVDVNNASGADTTFTIDIVCAKPLKHYVVLSAAGDNAADTQNRYYVTCPRGTNIIGGGGFSSSGSTSVNLNGDWPSSSTTWEIDINNGSSDDASVTVYEICAKFKAAGHYQYVVGSTNDNPPGAESNSNVSCFTGVELGGGISSNSGSTEVNLNTTDPDADGWNGWENNATGFDYQVTSYAVCAT
jgi:hypothetical protein